LDRGTGGDDTGVRGHQQHEYAAFENIEYLNINSIGKQWIRRFALAVCKEMLGIIEANLQHCQYRETV
jgi:hypothetical protein